MKTEWYHSVFMIHHPKRVGPTNDKVFGLLLNDCFHCSKTQNFEFGWWKLKTQFWCFHDKDLLQLNSHGWVLFSLSSSCLFFFHACFFGFFLFLSFFLHLFLFSTSSCFFLYFFFQDLWIFFVGLSDTFYRFLCLFLYFFFVFVFLFLFLVGLFGTFYGILMVISSFWSDLWVWSSGLRCRCGVWIFEMWLWVWVWGSDFVVWLWWFESKMWLWVSVWGLDLLCGCDGFGSEMWWLFLSLPLWVWVHVCMFKTILICFRFDFQIWWLLGREIKEEDNTCREKNECGIEREKILRVWTFVVLLSFWLMGSTTFE